VAESERPWPAHPRGDRGRTLQGTHRSEAARPGLASPAGRSRHRRRGVQPHDPRCEAGFLSRGLGGAATVCSHASVPQRAPWCTSPTRTGSLTSVGPGATCRRRRRGSGRREAAWSAATTPGATKPRPKAATAPAPGIAFSRCRSPPSTVSLAPRPSAASSRTVTDCSTWRAMYGGGPARRSRRSATARRRRWARTRRAR
jgi:hypothetical protein